MPDDSSLLSEIRANFEYAKTYWADVRKEAEKDVRYEIEGPWDEKDLQDREGRVTLSLDEFSQYLNQICNEFRTHQRSVKVNPRGDGADDQTAYYRAGMIREIEYQSKAQQAYVCAGENAVRRSYGYFKLITDWEPGSFNRVLKVVSVPNPDVIYLDPDFKEPDAADCGWAFEIERMRDTAFRSKFGKKAKIADFEAIDPQQPGAAWITSGDGGKHVQVASYWRREKKPIPLYLLENGQTLNPADVEGGVQLLELGSGKEKQQFAVFGGQQYRIVDEREDNEFTVRKFITNGLEILENEATDFREIPIIPVFGREVWITKGGTARRMFLSAIRLARDAYKAYCYARSAMVERLAMDPKTPYEGWEGQFNTTTDWANINKNQSGYAEFAIVRDPITQQPILDKPKRNLAEPQINQYEVASESLRRAIQAAMGSSPLPTSAQRQNQKSGIALQTIEQSNDQGNFHFIDNYDRALERAGRMMDQALDIVYDTPREHGIRTEGGEYQVVKINQRDDAGNPVGFHTGSGDHGVTITTGPSSQSQRDAADTFLDQLSQNEAVFPRIADLVVKLKNLGPIGDQIAERLAPAGGNMPPEVAGQIQQAQQTIAQLQQELQAAKAGDAIKKYTVDEQEKTKRVLGLLKVDQQDAETMLEQMLGSISERFDKLHDMHKTLLQQQHERAENEAQRAHQAAQTAQGQAHEMTMAEQQAAAAQQQEGQKTA